MLSAGLSKDVELGEPFPCKDCKQMLIFHEGRELVVNFYDGIGGQRGTRHICPHRMHTDPHHKESHKKLVSPFPRLKASVIICPEPECNRAIVQDRGGEDLVDQFVEHVKVNHWIEPTEFSINNLRAKIDFIRNNNRIHYQDPFVHVSFEELSKTSYR
jgi:hypothetical protein